jgi:hypothetical protein
MNLITNYVGRIPSITADVGALIGRLGNPELGEIRDSLIETENVSTDELLHEYNTAFYAQRRHSDPTTIFYDGTQLCFRKKHGY